MTIFHRSCSGRQRKVGRGPDDYGPVEVYAYGLINVSCCASDDLNKVAIERAVNMEFPTGISSRWEIAEETEFAEGEPMPSPCPHSVERQHWLLHC